MCDRHMGRFYLGIAQKSTLPKEHHAAKTKDRSSVFVVIVLSGVLGLFAQPDPQAAQTWAHVQQTLQQAGQ